jgi:23S rRNA G2445 N2-methylase RlmL
VTAVLAQADARTWQPPERPTLVVTNPPMGRRVARDRSFASMLDAVIANVARCLARRGRMVWLSPMPERTVEHAEHAGLVVARLGPVDMGGFDAELQTFTAR